MTLFTDLPQPSADDVNPSAFGADQGRWQTFLEFSNQKPAEAHYLFTQLRDNHPDIFNRLTGDGEVHITLLGVGSGEVELDFLTKVIEKRATSAQSNVFLHCEDPSEQMKQVFSNNLQKGKRLTVFSQAHIDFSPMKMEDPDYHIQPSDFVIVSHALYYVRGWKDTADEYNPLRKIMQAIEQRDGAAVIVVQGNTSNIWNIRDYYHILRKDHQTEVTGNDVTSVLEQLDVPFIDAIIGESDMNAGFFIHHDNQNSPDIFTFDPTVEGKRLLSFIFRTDWDSIPQDIQDKLGHIVVSHVQNNQNFLPHQFQAGRSLYWLKHNDAYIWVRPRVPTYEDRHGTQ
jgi:hypothetical protein